MLARTCINRKELKLNPWILPLEFDSLTHLPIKRHAYFSGKIAINTFLPNRKLQLSSRELVRQTSLHHSTYSNLAQYVNFTGVVFGCRQNAWKLEILLPWQPMREPAKRPWRKKKSSPWCETTHNVPILSVCSLNTGHNLDQSLARVLIQACIWLSPLGVAFRVQSNLFSFTKARKNWILAESNDWHPFICFIVFFPSPPSPSPPRLRTCMFRSSTLGSSGLLLSERPLGMVY